MLNAHAFVPLLAFFLGQLLLHIHLWKIIDSEVEIHDGVKLLFRADEVERCVVRLHVLHVCKT